MAFKIGDKVRCIDSNDSFITKGKIYTVSRDNGYVRLREYPGAGGWFRRRFELVDQELEDFKRKVVRSTLSHPSGCIDGKKEFLEGLGLEAKGKKWKISFEWEEDPNKSGATILSIQSAMRQKLATWSNSPKDFTIEEVQ